MAERQEISNLADEVILRIEQCVQHVRSIQAFAPASKESPLNYPLYSRINERGIVEEIQQTCQRVLQATDNSSLLNDLQLIPSDNTSERELLVCHVLLPLIEALSTCYQILDLQDPSTETSIQSTNKKHPDPGLLLSLRNYTDVACFLELTIATAVLPLMEPNILYTPAEFTKTMPKSIAGRLPSKSLVWWMSDNNMTASCNNKYETLELKLSAILVTKLLVLDRFRPMLLPRHLIHVYAAILQVMHNYEMQVSKKLESDDSWQRTLQYVNLESSNETQTIIDPLLQAKTYQTILRQGLAAPVWVRKMVGMLLSDMPLNVLAQVFCADSASAMRLARAVVSGTGALDTSVKEKNANTVNKVSILCKQVADLLDDLEWNETEEIQLRRDHVSALETVWSIIDLLLPTYKEIVVNHLMALTDQEPMRVIRRFGALMRLVPPFVSLEKVATLVFSRLSKNSLAIFEMALRAAALPSILHSSDKEQSQSVLRIMVRALLDTNSSVLSASHLLVVAMISSVTVHQWDREGNQLRACEADIGHERKGLSARTIIVERHHEELTANELVQGIEMRSKAITQHLLRPLLEESEQHIHQSSHIKLLIPDLFLRVLAMYFESNAKTSTSISLHSWAFHDELSALVPMVLLPSICEDLPLEALLAGNETLFGMMRVAFCAFAHCYGLVTGTSTEAIDQEGDHMVDFRSKLTEAADYFMSLSVPVYDGFSTLPSVVLTKSDVLPTICSLLLSLLVGILEIGNASRSDGEEQTIQSFAKILQLLSGDTKHLDGDPGREYVTIDIPPEIAELASHALALVVARRVPCHESQESTDYAEEESLFAQIEHDLRSDEPPIRARAVVALRHVAASTSDSSKLELSSNESDTWRCLKLSVWALCDTESFVYLASIQTIAAMADTSATIMQLVGVGIVTGIFRYPDNSIDELTNEQRAKLVEALVSVIKRKAILDRSLEYLISTMIVGDGKESIKPQPGHEDFDPGIVQIETHNYFVREDAETLTISAEEARKAMDTRINTGGPLFVLEENGVVRSGKIAVVAELVSKAHPSIIAPYCGLLVQKATEAILFSDERVVRRTGALLARELYRCLLRESNDSGQQQFAVRFIQASEEQLAVALERCSKGDDLEEVGTDRSRFFDPATVARCKEALVLRSHAHDEGIILAGRHALESLKANSQIATLLEPSAERSKLIPGLLSKKLIEEIE